MKENQPPPSIAVIFVIDGTVLPAVPLSEFTESPIYDCLQSYTSGLLTEYGINHHIWLSLPRPSK